MLERTVDELRRSAHLAGATLVPRQITPAGVSLEGCDAFLVLADANQSRLLVSNSARDTALPHSCLEAILALAPHRFALAVVGGRTRGFRNPEDGSVWSQTVERVLRQTEQTLALEVSSLSLFAHGGAVEQLAMVLTCVSVRAGKRRWLKGEQRCRG